MITVTSISPAKNETNVSVNKDIEIKLSADFKLDPRNISFKLNEIDIVPNVFSVYNGESDYELIVTLYTRRRIKFGDNHRYGQDGLRYGKRDIHPSVLEYGSRYTCSFKVWGENDSGEKEELNDSFLFSTEEGIFYNEKPKEFFYSDHTQAMANYLPEWARARYDKYSNFQQLLNPIGEVLEKNQDLINKVYQSNAIQTVNLKELPFLYKYEMDKNFEFETFFNQDGSTFFVQPEITGVQGITRFELFTTEENNLKSLYYGKVPTRLNNEQTIVKNNIIVSETKASDLPHVINKDLEREGGLVLYCRGVETSVYRDRIESYSLLKCQIKGTSIYDQKQTEELVIYEQDYLHSKKMWKSIESIQFFNIKKQNFTFEVLHFPRKDKKSLDSKKVILPSGDTDYAMWSFENRMNQSVLQKRKTLGDSGLDVLKFAGRTEVFQEMGLFDIDNETPLELKDIVVDYNSNYLYGITDDFLYVFDKREPYPESLKKIPGTNGDADFTLSIDTDELYLNEEGEKEVQLSLRHTTPGKKIAKYRIKITKPNGTSVFLMEDGSIETDPNKSSNYVRQGEFVLPTINNRITIDQPGEYIFELETMYQGGTVSKDFNFIFIKKNSAIAKYDLRRIMNESTPESIIIDFDQELKIYTDTKILHTIKFHRDGVVIDYVNKVIYSAEEYSSIDVE